MLSTFIFMHVIMDIWFDIFLPGHMLLIQFCYAFLLFVLDHLSKVFSRMFGKSTPAGIVVGVDVYMC